MNDKQKYLVCPVCHEDNSWDSFDTKVDGGYQCTNCGMKFKENTMRFEDMELHMSNLLEFAQKRYEAVTQDILENIIHDPEATDPKEIGILIGRARELRFLMDIMEKHMKDS